MRALVTVIAASCVLSCNCGDPPRTLADGDACTDGNGCISGACEGGHCSGSPCECGGICTEQRRSTCKDPWICVPVASSLNTKAICKKPCFGATGCPDGWGCQDGAWCTAEPPPAITIESAPEEVPVGAPAMFKGTATPRRGTLAKLEWRFSDLEVVFGELTAKNSVVVGTEVTQTFSLPAASSFRVTATDSNGVSGSVWHPLTICLPAGAACTPGSTQGSGPCCTFTVCGGDSDAGTTCR